ncbi:MULTISPECIES: DUF4925 domain-containing protein [unclassified Butyricimonas]|uniref:DUF4925 domain-containing protein n=1 Tax=unclassified Butyricimonas TaxID=2637652 RepID=UPI0030BF6F36
MKNKFLLLLILGVAFFASCSDDDDKAWKKIPQDEIEIQKVTFEVNGEQATTGTLQMTVKNGSEAVLTLKNVIPGYATIPVNVKLEEQADDSFVFSGEEGLATPPAMLIVRSDAKPVILNVKVEGKISVEGKVSATATTKLSEIAQAGLTGSWNLSATSSGENAPLFVVWSAIDLEKPNFENTMSLVNMFVPMVLFNALNQVTFHEDGNITAKYWENFSMENMFANQDKGQLIASHDDWSDSPKNLAFWYAKNSMIYIVPNINAIAQQVNGNNEGVDISNSEDIMTLLAKLKEYNIDVDVLLPIVMQWITEGIPVKYVKTDDALKIYIDKEMAAPFITPLLPALDKLQEDMEKIIEAGEDENTIEMIQLVLGVLQIEKLTDIKTIWEENTNEFEISLNFVSAK